MKKYFLFLLLYPVMAWSGSVEPPGITPALCEQRVQVDGMQIARLRWEHGMDKQALLDIPFSDEAPDWARALILGWIDEAYEWQGDPIAWLKKILAECKTKASS